MSSAAQHALLLPDNQTELGRYTLLYRFAAGGMANLYAARLPGSDGFEKIVAIKVMHPHLTSDAEFVKMFIDEARLASRITHPNVVQIFELGRAEGTHFIAMEHVEGESVLAVLRRSRLPHTTSVQIVAAAALGLHAAHELRDADGRPLEVVHRDVSPDNILVGYDGGVKVADFGVARARDSLHTTRSGAVKGKFAYMAPEQALGLRVDRRTDVFALGVLLFEMTTGHRLFRRPTEAEVLQAVIRCNVPRPSELAPGYPASLERVVLRALQRNPSGRFETALELHEALTYHMMEHREAPSVTATISETMHTLFADRIEEKRRLLRRHVEGPGDDVESVPYLECQTQGSSIERLVVSALSRRPRWPRRVAIALAVLLGVTALVLLVLPGPRRPAPRARGNRAVTVAPLEAPPAARAPVQHRTVRLKASPRGSPAHPLPAVRREAPRRRRARRSRKRRRRRQLADRDVLANPYVK